MAVWMCSGQGAQKVGMATDFFDLNEVVRVFDAVSKAINYDLAGITTKGTQEEINQAIPAQAITFATSVGIGKALQNRGIYPDAYVGFSLGEISALVLANILSLNDGIELLKVRSEAMDSACREHPGAMLALLGANERDAKEICEICAQGQVLVPANYNSPGQIVISGEIEAIDRAESAWKSKGKKAVRLATAGAFHSPLMAQASSAIAEIGKTIEFREGNAPVICNTDACVFDVNDAISRLSRQVQQGVKFMQSINYLIDKGQDTFIEIGYGSVLTNLVKRIDKNQNRISVGNRKQFDALVQ